MVTLFLASAEDDEDDDDEDDEEEEEEEDDDDDEMVSRVLRAGSAAHTCLTSSMTLSALPARAAQWMGMVESLPTSLGDSPRLSRSFSGAGEVQAAA